MKYTRYTKKELIRKCPKCKSTNVFKPSNSHFYQCQKCKIFIKPSNYGEPLIINELFGLEG